MIATITEYPQHMVDDAVNPVAPFYALVKDCVGLGNTLTDAVWEAKRAAAARRGDISRCGGCEAYHTGEHACDWAEDAGFLDELDYASTGRPTMREQGVKVYTVSLI